MHKRTIAIVGLCLGALPLATMAADESAGARVYKLHAQNGSHEFGTIAFKPRGDVTNVEIHIVNAPPGVAQPAHIHLGTCANLDPAPKYPLEPVLDGVSETVVKVPLSSLLATPMALNVHKSAADVKDYVACADIKP